MNRRFWCSFALLVASPGCGSAKALNSNSSDLLDHCTGTATCSVADQPPEQGELRRVGGECQLDGAFTLTPMGAVYAVGTTTDTGLTWSGDAEQFQVCGTSDCAICTVARAADTAPTTAGSCKGSPWQCSSLSAGSCVSDGCSFTQHLQWDGSFEYDCEGTARACSHYTNAGSCELQSGCYWK